MADFLDIEIDKPKLTSYQKDFLYNEARFTITEASTKVGKTFAHIWWIFEQANKMKGGNQTELYKGNDPKKNLLKAKMIEAVWPQYSKTVIRFGRHHHLINWKVFKK